jgi:hypothetical protein
MNFWPGFSLDSGLIGWLFKRAVGNFSATSDEKSADVVITSVYGKARPKFPEKTICLIWENARPNYSLYRYSLSSDFDTYLGRNCRLPVWYQGLAWPGMERERRPPNERNHGLEPLIDMESLYRPRASVSMDRESFCCFVAGNHELHRLHAVEALSQVGRVEVFGNVGNRPLRASKFDLLKQFRFNICFENSTYPGYYTEKLVHAWVGGCVPLYFADPWCRREFNSRAFINRTEFTTLDDFAKHVATIEASKQAQVDIASEPLLLEAPSLEPVVEFLRQACERMATARALPPQAQRTEAPSDQTMFVNAARLDGEYFMPTLAKLPRLLWAALRRRLSTR